LGRVAAVGREISEKRNTRKKRTPRENFARGELKHCLNKMQKRKIAAAKSVVRLRERWRGKKV